jgi:hypothetical protein
VKISLQQELVEAGLRLRHVIARVAKETPEYFTRKNGKWCAEFRNPISGELLTVTYSCPTKPVNQAQQN